LGRLIFFMMTSFLRRGFEDWPREEVPQEDLAHQAKPYSVLQLNISK
jgi:hypothetical protein